MVATSVVMLTAVGAAGGEESTGLMELVTCELPQPVIVRVVAPRKSATSRKRVYFTVSLQ